MKTPHSFEACRGCLQEIDELKAALAAARAELGIFYEASEENCPRCATARAALDVEVEIHDKALSRVRAVAMEEAARAASKYEAWADGEEVAEAIRALAPLPASLVLVEQAALSQALHLAWATGRRTQRKHHTEDFDRLHAVLGLPTSTGTTPQAEFVLVERATVERVKRALETFCGTEMNPTAHRLNCQAEFYSTPQPCDCGRDRGLDALTLLADGKT